MRLNHTLMVFAILSMPGFLLAQPAAPAGDAKVELISMKIGKPVSEQVRELVFGDRGGLSLSLILTRADRFIIAIDEDASKLTQFTDDKGTDFIKPSTEAKDFRGPSNGISPFSKISKDGHMCAVEVQSSTPPAPGATRINLQANLVLKCGTDEKTVEQKDLVLKKDSKLTAGPVPMTITNVQDASGDMKMSIAFSHAKPADAIKSLVFLGPDGKEIKSYRSSWGSGGFGNVMTYESTYELAEKVEKASVRITYFNQMETLNVPLNIQTGVGF